MRALALALLSGCGPSPSAAIFSTVDRSQVIPGAVRVDTGTPDTGDTGEDTGPFTGGCLEFHGDPDHFVGGDAALPLGDAARTVEFWFKNANQVGADLVVAYGASGAGFGVGFYNGFPMAQAGGGRIYAASGAATDGSWHHLGVSWDPASGLVSFWIDGVLDSQVGAAVSTTAGGTLGLGDDPSAASPGEAFEGVIDEVHIWSRALSEGEYGGLYKDAPADLVGWYTMNQEGSGASLVLANAAGEASLDLTSVGAPAFVPCKY